MDRTAITELAALVVLILLSAYFSSAETALTTVSRISLKTKADEGSHRAALVLRILDDDTRMLSAILIMNNIVNLSASALAASFVIHNFGENLVSVGTAILTVLIILFGEITPKNISKIRAESISMADAPVILALMVVLTPVITVINFLSGGILRLFGVRRDERHLLTENELKTYVEVGHEDGAIEGREKKIIYNVFDFGDSVARDIMVPRIDMECVSANADYEQVMAVFRREMFTRLPVYQPDNPDEIIGHLNIKDFITVQDAKRFHLKSLLHESYYTYEYKRTADLLKEMQQHSFGVAFVLDEFGNTVGMITLEDLVEEIVGEIRDEYDEDEKQQVRKYDDKTYLVDGSMKLLDVNDQLGTEFDSEDYDSIGGLIIEKLERLPRNGESITLDDGTRLEAKGIRRNRIVKVLIRLREVPAPTDELDSPAQDATAAPGKETDGAPSDAK
ncbi:Hemolysin, contains CBS domains [Lachnospiraceae bacterium NK3A20]|nr:Hemolysin, contains CBS domains [Lachnospiraceae bacterium NK3A20]